jgi:hypothetical protein
LFHVEHWRGTLAAQLSLRALHFFSAAHAFFGDGAIHFFSDGYPKYPDVGEITWRAMSQTRWIRTLPLHLATPAPRSCCFFRGALPSRCALGLRRFFRRATTIGAATLSGCAFGLS